jgi:hypothetical protein
MKTVLKLLRKELKKWKAKKTDVKKLYQKDSKEYINHIRKPIRHIQELETSIKVINDYLDNKIDFVEKFKHIKLHK